MKDQDKIRPTEAGGQQHVSQLTELRQRIAELDGLETERKQAEEELRRDRDHLEELVDEMNRRAGRHGIGLNVYRDALK